MTHKINYIQHLLLAAVGMGMLSTTHAGDLHACPQFTKYGPPLTVSHEQNVGSRFICHQGYSMQHSAATKGALWVAEYLRPEKAGGVSPLNHDYAADPELPEAERATTNDYQDVDLDYGKYAAASNFRTDATHVKEAFYLSNVGPIDKSMNNEVWREISKYVRKLTTTRKHGLYIVTGPVHALQHGSYIQTTTASACPSTAVQPGCTAVFTKKGTIGKQKVFVPIAYYKVLLDPETGTTLAFVVPNMPMPKNTGIKPWIRSVRDVETLAHIDFHSALNAQTRDKIEMPVATLWTN